MIMLRSNPLVVRTYLLRGAVLWLLARTLISAVIVAADGNPFAVSARSAVIIVGVSAVLALAQTARLRERVLLGNLGVPAAALVAYFALPALAGELILAVLGAALW
jgi:hypothetical protein